ncbi:hypothetical protein FOA52_009729 [Chlamydomonas sp. UWO 241]|nr:hypothetical protein FOA52_009729 [Chlamydomonas sp. UWO 241]
MAFSTSLKPSARPAARQLACSKVSRRTTVSVQAKKVLMMGGTRFIGLYLARQLVQEGHEVTLFTRGKKEVASMIPDDTPESFENFKKSIHHMKGDRMEFDMVTERLKKEKFEAVYDINGRESIEARPVLEGCRDTLEQYIYCSSAGVYMKSDMMPHRETDAGDVKSRHKGKLDTETYLATAGVAYTSVRPVYIYGPLNYNPVEEWFFQRIAAGRPVPVPSSGMQITQLGHVKDLSDAFVKCLGNKKAYNQIYNVSGEQYVTFDGLAKACAKAMGKDEPELVHYTDKDYDFGKKKAFPMRDQHFFTSIDKAMADLNWKPQFSLLDGLKDSYTKDFGRGTMRKAADFETDDMILAKVKGLANA